jgi:hypothetical protein
LRARFAETDEADRFFVRLGEDDGMQCSPNPAQRKNSRLAIIEAQIFRSSCAFEVKPLRIRERNAMLAPVRGGLGFVPLESGRRLWRLLYIHQLRARQALKPRL